MSTPLPPRPFSLRAAIVGAAAGVCVVLALYAVDAVIGGWSLSSSGGSQPAVVAQAKPGDCRSFSKVIPVGDQQRTVHGTVCLGTDGAWSLVPSQPQS